MNLHGLTERQNKELTYLGYTKLEKIDEYILSDLVNESVRFIQAAKKEFPKGKLFNLINSTFENKTRSIEIVSKYLTAFLREKLDNNQVDIFSVSHLVKPFGLKSDIWHQDSSVVDERNDFSLNAWMPLVKSTKWNGCMWMLPGSHINTNYFRQFGHNYITKEIKKYFKKHMVPLKVGAGEVVLFHRNIIHSSSVNLLPMNRIAIESVVIPKNAQLYNYHREEKIAKGKILAFKVDLEHFYSAQPKDDFYNGRLTYDLIDDHDFKERQDYLLSSISEFIEHAKKLTHA